MTVSVRQIGGGSDHGAADSRIGALSSAADSGPTLIVTGASAFEAAIETDSAPIVDGGSLAPANDPLMRAIEIGLAGLAFGSAVLLAFMR
jgi:hypothetical protein